MQGLKQVQQALLRWYKKHGRTSLPWRNTTDPYAIYVSEVMLQQTQVQTVLERYYFPFLAKFPTLKALAHAPEQEVLKAWQGLGYYSRAVNLHKAVKQLPYGLVADIDALMKLPGVGRNTAHAIAAFGFHMAVPVMEANVKRILCRVFALETASEKLLWEKAYQLLDEENPFDYNQAMMDIGALICTKAKPKCDICPLASLCAGKANPAHYPVKVTKKPVPVIEKHIVVFSDSDNHFYLAPRSTRFLYGLYGFAEYDAAAAIYFENTHYPLESLQPLGAIRQSYSHFTLEAKVYLQKLAYKGEGEHWKAKEAISGLPLSMADSKVLGLMEGYS